MLIRIFLIITVIIFSTANFATAGVPPKRDNNDNVSVMYKEPPKEQMRKQFEQRLNLTEKQKEQARIIHQQGRREMKPVMMQIEIKRQETDNIRLSKLSEKEQNERIDKLNGEISALERRARDIRKKNTQEFENILNKTQKAELEKMKAEGRARFEKSHQARPPFQGLGTPQFLVKPLLPPPKFAPWDK